MAVVSMTVNGKAVSAETEDRTLLVYFLREQLRLTGTHIGCDTSQCGACVVHVNGRAVKSCSMFAVQAEGANVLTIEGLAKDGKLHPVQEALRDNHGLQCGFCTPGFVLMTRQLLAENPDPSEDEIRHYLSGNLCRCAAYPEIIEAVKLAAQKRNRGQSPIS